MGERCFTDAELAALARTPRRQFADALDGVDDTDAAAVFASLARAFTNFIDGFSSFVAGVQEHVRTVHGFAAAGTLDAAIFRSGLREVAYRGFDGSVLDAADADRAAAAIDDALARDDRVAALAAYDHYEKAVRVVHDLGSGRAAAALTHVYRVHGVDDLEACIRLCGDRSLLQWMPRDIERPAEQRVKQWARMMSGNFAEIRIEETDDAFVITQDPCGTCGRQVLDGCYAPPVDFAVVSERHPITWDRGEVPVYRTHVAVMHDLMPMERIGVRWPEISCPQGVSGGPCRIVLRKDPRAGAPSTPAGS